MPFRNGAAGDSKDNGYGRTDFRKDISGVFHLFSSPIFYQFW